MQVEIAAVVGVALVAGLAGVAARRRRSTVEELPARTPQPSAVAKAAQEVRTRSGGIVTPGEELDLEGAELLAGDDRSGCNRSILRLIQERPLTAAKRVSGLAGAASMTIVAPPIGLPSLVVQSARMAWAISLLPCED